eukprot:m.367878 g.367878  ORF g.367878 m.367878 type:complete len:54 (-) comp42722_c0_seq1:15-176(-)
MSKLQTKPTSNAQFSWVIVHITETNSKNERDSLSCNKQLDECGASKTCHRTWQ